MIAIVGVTRSGKSTYLRALAEAHAARGPVYVIDLYDAYPSPQVHTALPLPFPRGRWPVVYRPPGVVPSTEAASAVGIAWAAAVVARGGTLIVDECHTIIDPAWHPARLPPPWARAMTAASKRPAVGLAVAAQRAVLLHPTIRSQARLGVFFRQVHAHDLEAVAAMLPPGSPIPRLLPTLPNLRYVVVNLTDPMAVPPAPRDLHIAGG